LGYLLTRGSDLEDRDDSPAVWRRLKRIAAPGLAIYAFTVNFAATDWVMSLDPHWYSTMYGFLFIAQHLLSTMALAICMLVLLSAYAPMREIVRPDRLHDVGKLMLAMTMLWAYFSFSQWLIIWMANLPEEISWYLARIKQGWQIVALLLVLLQFSLPFLLLLSRDLKRDARKLAAVALLVLAMRLVDAYWLIAPNPFPGPQHEQIYLSWTYLAAPAALLGLWFAFFFWNLGRRPLLVKNEPQLARLWESSHVH
jgi:Ni/Fe-hydrogenase subunit HybB-like protein